MFTPHVVHTEVTTVELVACVLDDVIELGIGLPQHFSLVPAHAGKDNIERSAAHGVCTPRNHVPVSSHFTYSLVLMMVYHKNARLVNFCLSNT